MENTFKDFPDVAGVVVESTEKAEDKSEDTKRVVDCLSKIIKELHKQNKLFKQLCRRTMRTATKEPDAGEPAVEEQSTAHKENCRAHTTGKKTEKSFLGKLGDAFLKALPSILRTVAAVAVPLFFSCISKRMGNYRRVVT